MIAQQHRPEVEPLLELGAACGSVKSGICNVIRLLQYNQTAAVQSDCSSTIRLQQCNQTAAV